MGLDDSSIHFSPEFPFSIGFPSAQVPTDAISGCGMTCFSKDRWYVDILIGDLGIEIGVREAPEVIDWCWEQGLPMVSGTQRRGWLYEGGELPRRDEYEQVGREEYRRKTRRSCQGF